MENVKSLESRLLIDMANALKTAIDAFSKIDGGKSDSTFYRVFAEELYKTAVGNDAYRKINSEVLNNKIIPNIYDTLKIAESLALEDPATFTKVNKMAKREINKTEGILKVMPNFPPAYNPYHSLKEYTLSALIHASENTEFELRGMEPVFNLYFLINAGDTYIGKRTRLLLYFKEWGPMEYFCGSLHRV